MCAAEHMTQGNSDPSCLQMNSSKEYKFILLMLSKDWSCSKNQHNSCFLIQNLLNFKEVLFNTWFWIIRTLDIRVCLRIRGRKCDHRTNVRGGDRNIITRLFKLDKRNHGTTAIEFINCVIAEVVPTPCRMFGDMWPGMEQQSMERAVTSNAIRVVFAPLTLGKRCNMIGISLMMAPGVKFL